jgi:hypothetical protein
MESIAAGSARKRLHRHARAALPSLLVFQFTALEVIKLALFRGREATVVNWPACIATNAGWAV